MADVIFVVVALGFFALCVAYVRGIDRLVSGTDETGLAPESVDVTDEEVAR